MLERTVRFAAVLEICSRLLWSRRSWPDFGPILQALTRKGAPEMSDRPPFPIPLKKIPQKTVFLRKTVLFWQKKSDFPRKSDSPHRNAPSKESSGRKRVCCNSSDTIGTKRVRNHIQTCAVTPVTFPHCRICAKIKKL